MTTFNIGDIVQLKSGGPDMTVSSIDTEEDECDCCWFNGKKVESARFKAEVLIYPDDNSLDSELSRYC